MQGVKLVDLERVKFLLNVIHAHDDARLELLTLAASQYVLDYLGISYDELTGADSESSSSSEDGTGLVPEVEQIATAMLVGKLYDGWTQGDAVHGRLPPEVEALLYIRKRGHGIS